MLGFPIKAHLEQNVSLPVAQPWAVCRLGGSYELPRVRVSAADTAWLADSFFDSQCSRKTPPEPPGTQRRVSTRY